jgi:hypothetical protein
MNFKENWDRAESAWDSSTPERTNVLVVNTYTGSSTGGRYLYSFAGCPAKVERAVEYVKKLFEEAVRGVVERV